MDAQLFDDPEIEEAISRDPGLASVRGSDSTAETMARYAFLKTKKPGETWYEGGGRFLYRMGPQGVTVFDTNRWSV